MAPAEKGTDLIKFNIQMERELLDKGKGLARRKGVSFAGLLRYLLVQEIEKAESK